LTDQMAQKEVKTRITGTHLLQTIMATNPPQKSLKPNR
jgi:hypothetical protein